MRFLHFSTYNDKCGSRTLGKYFSNGVLSLGWGGEGREEWEDIGMRPQRSQDSGRSCEGTLGEEVLKKSSQDTFEGGKGGRNKCQGVLTHTGARPEQQSWTDDLSSSRVGNKQVKKLLYTAIFPPNPHPRISFSQNRLPVPFHQPTKFPFNTFLSTFPWLPTDKQLLERTTSAQSLT